MPVIAIAAIAGAAFSGVSAINNARNAKKQNQILEQQTAQQQTLIDEQKKGAELARGYANDFLPVAKKNLLQVDDYWQKIFGGDKNKINELLAPEMNSYLQSTNAVEKALNIFGNRGNVGDRLIGSEFTKAANLAGARLNLKNQSAGQIQNIGSQLANLGLSSLASASGQTSAASAALSGQQNITIQRAQNYSNAAAAAGQNIGTLLGSMNWQAKSVGDFFGMGKGQKSGGWDATLYGMMGANG